MHALAPWVGAALLVGGLALLRQSWSKRSGIKAHLRLAGWLCVSTGFAAFGWSWGAELGTAHAFAVFSLIAYGLVAIGAEVRTGPGRAPREAAEEPEERATSWSRAIAKSLLAVLLSGIAAIGVGLAFALYMPMPTQDRIVIGGILVPVLWGAGMAWTLSDARLMRATLLLVAISAACYGAAFLPKAFL